CNSCHAFGRKLTGPDLAGMSDRQSLDWIVKWIHNPQGMVDSGDQYAIDLVAQDPTMMAPYAHLTESDIADIMAYVDQETVKLQEKKDQAATRSEERRVGKECRYRWSPEHYKKRNARRKQNKRWN